MPNTIRRLLPILLTLLLAACGGNGSGPGSGNKPDPNPDVIVNEDVRVLEQDAQDDLTNFDLDLQTGSGELRFKAGDPAVQALEPGLILVSEPVPGVAPHGFLQRIESKRLEGDEVVLTTSQAMLIETFKKAEIDFRQTLTPDDVVSTTAYYEGISFETPSEGITPQAGANFDFQLNFDEVLIDADDDESTTDDQLRLDGDFYFNAAASADIDIDCCQEVDWFPDILPYLDLFEFKVTLDESVDLSLSGDLGLSFDETIEVARYYFGAFTVMAGPVPVVFVVDLVVDIGANGQLSAHLSVSAKQSTHMQLGARYTDTGGWEDLTEFDSDFDFPTPQISASASARAFAKPMLNVKIYGLAGPYVYAEPYVEADAELYRDPFWTFTAGIDFGLGFVIDLPVVGRVAQWDTELAGFETTLGESENRAPTLEVLSPDDGTTRPEGWGIIFELRAKDREQKQVMVTVTDESGNRFGDPFPVGDETREFMLRDLCPGSYTYRLTATDDRGATDQKTISTTVENVVPSVTVGEKVYDTATVYSGGLLFGTAEAFDTVCKVNGNGADQDLIEWYVDGEKVGSTDQLDYFLDTDKYPADSTITLSARYHDGTVADRSEPVKITLAEIPADQLNKPQAVVLEPYDGQFTTCYHGSQQVKGMGYLLGGGRLDGDQLTWEIKKDGVFVPAGQGEVTTLTFDIFDGENVGENEWSITFRLTATSGGESASVTSHFTFAVCG